jgi:hypothetical protein
LRLVTRSLPTGQIADRTLALPDAQRVEDLTALLLRGYLKDEYLLLQDQYEDFDRRTLTIKSWIGTGAFAAQEAWRRPPPGDAARTASEPCD